MMSKCSMGMGMMGAPSSEVDDESLCDGKTTGGSGTRMPKIRVGNRNLTMHSELVEMRESTDLLHAKDFGGLRKRLDEDGFLFLRGVIPRETVAKARAKMLQHLAEKGATREGSDWRDALIEYSSVWEEKQKQKKKQGGASKRKQPASSSNNSVASAKSSGGMFAKSMGSTGGGMMMVSNCKDDDMMSVAASVVSTGGSHPARKMIPGWTVDAESGGIIGGREPDSAVSGWYEIGNSRELTDVYNGAALKSFYQNLFAEDAEYKQNPAFAAKKLPSFSALPSCTWLRAKGPGEVTAEHADYYYFYKNTHIFRDFWVDESEKQQNTKQRSAEEKETCQICHDPKDPASTLICDLCNCGYHSYCLKPAIPKNAFPTEEQEWHCYNCTNLPMNYWTCWTTMTDIAHHDGRLALIAGSHRLNGYEDAVREDLLPRGYTKSFENQSIWQTPTQINMGDIILFNIKTVHAATKNAGERFRLSLDTRVTTCKGAQYLEDNNLDALPAAAASTTSTSSSSAAGSMLPPAPVDMKKKFAKEPVVAATDAAGTITAVFKKQKVKGSA